MRELWGSYVGFVGDLCDLNLNVPFEVLDILFKKR